MRKIYRNMKRLFIILSLIFILANISTISATEIDDNVLTFDENQLELTDGNQIVVTPNQDLKQIIYDCAVNDVILLKPGTYKVHDINLTKNITFQGNGNARDITIDGEKKGTIFHVESPAVYATFNNITFINGLTDSFGGAISMVTGNVFVDSCNFINNTALSDTNAGAIANFGTLENKGYLFVNNSFFMNNHADQDGGAVATTYANSDIYNSVFINNSARRDGGAFRVSVEGYANVQDCIFMFNYAKEWGGAYYSWVGGSNIERCIFLNNTAGTNGGAIMVSGNLNLTDSIIVNNTGKRTGGSFYIQEPMNDNPAVIKVKNNLITNNTSRLGKEIFVKWRNSKLLYTYFDGNDWGDEDPNDSSLIDPNNNIRTKYREISSTIKSNLLDELDMSLMDKYDDLIHPKLPNSEDDNQNQNTEEDVNNDVPDENLIPINSNNKSDVILDNNTITDIVQTIENITQTITNASQTIANTSQTLQDMLIEDSAVGDLTSAGENKNAYELNEKDSVAKQAYPHIEYFIALAIIIFLALLIGYREKNKE